MNWLPSTITKQSVDYATEVIFDIQRLLSFNAANDVEMGWDGGGGVRGVFPGGNVGLFGFKFNTD